MLLSLQVSSILIVILLYDWFWINYSRIQVASTRLGHVPGTSAVELRRRVVPKNP